MHNWCNSVFSHETWEASHVHVSVGISISFMDSLKTIILNYILTPFYKCNRSISGITIGYSVIYFYLRSSTYL